jgi:hypothetical protein
MKKKHWTLSSKVPNLQPYFTCIQTMCVRLFHDLQIWRLETQLNTESRGEARMGSPSYKCPIDHFISQGRRLLQTQNCNWLSTCCKIPLLPLIANFHMHIKLMNHENLSSLLQRWCHHLDWPVFHIYPWRTLAGRDVLQNLHPLIISYILVRMCHAIWVRIWNGCNSMRPDNSSPHM